MKTVLKLVAVWGVLFVLGSLPVLAHHSFAAEYDANKPVNLKGTVSQVEWTNPHVLFFIDVKDESGKVSNWQCELGPPNSLVRAGWTPKSLKQGDEVTVEGYAAKDGTTTLTAHTVKLSDGRTVFGGQSYDR